MTELRSEFDHLRSDMHAISKLMESFQPAQIEQYSSSNSPLCLTAATVLIVSIYHAALLPTQGVGRLFRSVEDQGALAVLDPRLTTAGTCAQRCRLSARRPSRNRSQDPYMHPRFTLRTRALTRRRMDPTRR